MALTNLRAYVSTGASLVAVGNGMVLHGSDGGAEEPPAEEPATRDDLVAGVDQPTLENTGVLDGVSRTDYSGGSESSLPSGTYENLNFPNGDIVLVNGRTYTFRNCLFHGAGDACDSLVRAYGAGTWTAQFYDCSFVPEWSAHDDDDTTGGHTQAADGIKGHHFELYRCQFLNCVDGVFIFDTTNPGVDVGVVVQQCYIGGAAFWRPDEQGRPEGTHNDGISINDGHAIQIVGNTIVWFNDPAIGDAAFSEFTGGDGELHGLEADNDPEQWANGDGIFARRSVGTIDALVIDQNWITGGIVNIRISGSSGTITNITITGNRLGNDGVDEGSAGANMSIDTDSYTDRILVAENHQVDGTGVSMVLT